MLLYEVFLISDQTAPLHSKKYIVIRKRNFLCGSGRSDLFVTLKT